MANPKLKEALKEIQEVLTKHDLAGFVLLADQKEIDYLYAFGASWTCARLEGRELKIRAEPGQYLTEADMMTTMADTVSLFLRLGNGCVGAIADFEKIAVAIGQQADITNITRTEPTENEKP